MSLAVKFDGNVDKSIINKVSDNIAKIKGVTIISKDSDTIYLDGYPTEEQIRKVAEESGACNITIG